MVYPSMSRALSVSIILREFETANVLQLEGAQSTKSKIRTSQKDISNLIALTTRVNKLFFILGSDSKVSDSLSVTDHYSPDGHHLLRLVELVITSFESLISISSAREHIDVLSIIKYFNSDEAWRVSGWGLLATEGYCRCIQNLLFILYRRRSALGLDATAFEMIVQKLFMGRVVERPPFRWPVFHLLFFTTKDLGDKIKNVSLIQKGLRAGLLQSFHNVQSSIESCLVLLEGDSRPKEVRKAITAMRHAVSRKLDALVMQEAATANNIADKEAREEPDGSQKLSLMPPSASLGHRPTTAGNNGGMLSFYQLLAFSAVKGMPETDLTKEENFVLRAKATHLVEESTSSADVLAEVLTPSFLRLFIASAFNVPQSVSDSTTRKENTYNRGLHAFLSGPSVIALYDSVQQHILGTSRLHNHYMPSIYSIPNASRRSYSFHSSRYMHLILRNMLYLSSFNVIWEEENSDKPIGGEKKPSEEVILSKQFLEKLEETVGLFFDLNQTAYEAELAAAGKRSLSSAARRVTDAGKDTVSFTIKDLETPTLFMVQQLSILVCNPDLVVQLPLFRVLQVVAKVFALRVIHEKKYILAKGNVSKQERREARILLSLLEGQLKYIPTKMSPANVNRVLVQLSVPKCLQLFQSYVPLNRSSGHSSNWSGDNSLPSPLQLSLLEAYLKALTPITASFAITRENMLRYWVDVAVPCITQSYSERLAAAGHDFLVSPALSKIAVAPLFIPTYVALFIPVEKAGNRKYPEPSVNLVKHFASYVRSVCGGLEKCNATKLSALLEDTSSEVYTVFSLAVRSLEATANTPADRSTKSMGVPLSPDQQRALGKVTPVSAVLLVVSSLFDKLCLLWSTPVGSREESQQRFISYFSALTFLLKCEDSYVLHRVSASIEAIMLEHLQDSKNLQRQFLKYIGQSIDGIQGTHKRGVTEWYLSLCGKVQKNTRAKL
ncbi:hypothetical protein, conserved [Angomonas deanei]|uniref:Uncharacterized protein n=1 Tax=Angomonas deanei TaxID=59799 RepID=A0A7G2C0G5_9TRYP|nr:hypothetical protein, conserved [Angomonas deanei]